MNISREVVVIGGGPAGLAAALEAKKCGLQQVTIIERDNELGGILQQCIHNGFGLHIFNEELTGPEYAHRFIEQVEQLGIEVFLNTMVLEIDADRTIYAASRDRGFIAIEAGSIVLAMGCRERTRGAINIPGTRPAGIFTAGVAQRFVNMEGYMPGERVVILGSGDIGLIMARRLTLEGAEVECVLEIMPYSNGLVRNVVQCLNDFGIPLYCNHTVIEVHGKERVEGVTIARVDENLRPLKGTESYIECDTLLLSVGLIPENELSKKAGVEIDGITGGPVVTHRRETSIPGIFACGNVVHVHDLVDYVTEEGMIAGRGAAEYIKKGPSKGKPVRIKAGKDIRYVVPQLICPQEIEEDSISLYMRCSRPLGRSRVVLRSAGGEKISQKVIPLGRPAEMIEFKLGKEQLQAMMGHEGFEVSVFER